MTADIATMIDDFVLPKNLINLIGREVSRELDFDEDTTFDVTYSFTTDYTRLITAFISTKDFKPLCVIFYFSKKPGCNWWMFEEKFRLKDHKAKRVVDAIDVGGSIKLEANEDEQIIYLEILESTEVLFWCSDGI